MKYHTNNSLEYKGFIISFMNEYNECLEECISEFVVHATDDQNDEMVFRSMSMAFQYIDQTIDGVPFELSESDFVLNNDIKIDHHTQDSLNATISENGYNSNLWYQTHYFFDYLKNFQFYIGKFERVNNIHASTNIPKNHGKYLLCIYRQSHCIFYEYYDIMQEAIEACNTWRKKYDT